MKIFANDTVLVLTRDVANPKPDRRKVRSFEALPTWPKGSTILYKGKAGHVPHVEAKGWYGIINGYDAGFDDLIEACEPAPRSLANILWAAHEGLACTSAHDVLESLIEMHRITLDDVCAAIGHNYAKEMARPDEV
jgi:hypothetical protein